MRARQTTVLTNAAMALAALAGCTSTADGTAIPATGTSSTERPASRSTGPGPADNHGAPNVSTPLDATSFLTKPCAALTPVQLQALNLPAQGETDTDSSVAKAVGPRCVWQNSQAGDTVGIAFMTGNKNGLADLYRVHQLGSFHGYWIETTIEEYPGILADENDGRASGTCALSVGIANTLAVHITEVGQLDDEQKSCDRAKQVASAVVQTLKAGG